MVGPIDRIRIIRLILALNDCDHELAESISARLTARGSRYVGHYYKAVSRFSSGNDDDARTSIDEFLALDPRHVDGHLLRSEIARQSGASEEAWRAVESAASHSARPKILLQASHLVDQSSDLDRLRSLHRRLADGQNSEALDGYLVAGAVRAREYEFARAVLENSVRRRLNSGRRSCPSQKRADLSMLLGQRALLDLQFVLGRADIPFFLVSGTFLGCVREGRLLGHDKDIDVGVWDDVAPARVVEAVKTSGSFLLHAQRSPNTLRLSHLNGVAVDIFWHHREEASYWHGGVKVRWHNTPFTLTPRDFLGSSFLAPADADCYLTENYGDWRLPAKDFDCAYDTPNAEVVSWDEMTVHALRSLLLWPSSRRLSLYLDTLGSHGEAKFVAEFKAAADLRHWASDWAS